MRNNEFLFLERSQKIFLASLTGLAALTFILFTHFLQNSLVTNWLPTEEAPDVKKMELEPIFWVPRKNLVKMGK
ncbi:hypothetical protein E2C01_027337 [Portunus trituberculatus]|uniref:Uncharacterized protein n=1 Tax=Portunus trituberculatus TaxID=210409 RepID=A0A5B7EL27_PORTR|nr:hypothetical protein [Portunus trituberculatus]